MTDANQPRLTMLGGFELDVPGRGERPAVARKAKALIAFLALNPERPQTRDRLATLLWGERGQTQARHSLRQALAGLRKVLPGDRHLWTTSEEIAIRGLDVDVLRFAELVRCDSTVALEEAVALYSGELLEGFDARAPVFDDWLSVERSRLRELAVSAMVRLLKQQNGSETAESSVRLALRLLALDPLRESTSRELMRSYAALGRAPDAVLQYRRLRRLLKEQLQVEPEPATTELYRRIIANRARDHQDGDSPNQSVSNLHGRDATGDAIGDATFGSGPVAAVPQPSTAALEQAAVDDPEASAELRQLAVLALRWKPSPTLLASDPEELGRSEAVVAERLAELARDFACDLSPPRHGSAELVFGRVRARSDDCERALHAAVQLGDSVARHPGGAISAAVHCGQALCTRIGTGSAAEGTVPSGPVLHQSIELLRDVADGEVLLSEAVRRRVQRWVEVEAIGSMATPASPEATDRRCWRLLRLSTLPSRADTPLVGRRRELALLRAGLEAIADVGGGHVVLIRGEAGIGKTRLVEALRSEADRLRIDDCLVRVLDFGTGTLADPTGVLLRGLLGLANDAPTQLVSQTLARVLASSGPAVMNPRVLGPLIGLADELEAGTIPMSEASRTQALREVVGTLLRAMTTTRPRLILVEDIHWAAAPMLAFLAAVAEASAQAAAMLVMTTRFEGEPLDPRWRAAMQGAP
ncbi:MAG: BTAD domain-containing putative transcriptional regulator, partial [Thiohalocapsa sp.]